MKPDPQNSEALERLTARCAEKKVPAALAFTFFQTAARARSIMTPSFALDALDRKFPTALRPMSRNRAKIAARGMRMWVSGIYDPRDRRSGVTLLVRAGVLPRFTHR